MFIMGVISCFTLYMLAPHLAKLVIDGNDQTGNSVAAVTTNIQIVSFALILVPVMSLLRGFSRVSIDGAFCSKCSCRAIFSGINHLDRKLCRFICFKSFSLTSCWYFNVRCLYGSDRWTNCFKCVLHKEEKALKEKEMASIPQTTKSFFSLYKELFTYSIPFVVVGLAIPLYQTIDTFTINKLLIQIGYMQGEAEKINAIIGLVQMVVLIPVSVATAFSMSLVPEMTKAYTAGNVKLLYKHFTRTNLLVVGITVPAAIGMMVLAKPVYTLLFGAGNDPRWEELFYSITLLLVYYFRFYSNGCNVARN